MEQVFIYIIITVILILTSVRKGKKQQQAKLEQQRKRQEAENMQQASKSDPLNEIFKQFGGDFFDELNPTVQEVPVQQQKTTDPFLSYELQKLKTTQKPKRKTTKTRVSIQEPEMNESDRMAEDLTQPEIFGPETADDWKKAIIYSEIMNRKYV